MTIYKKGKNLLVSDDTLKRQWDLEAYEAKCKAAGLFPEEPKQERVMQDSTSYSLGDERGEFKAFNHREELLGSR